MLEARTMPWPENYVDPLLEPLGRPNAMFASDRNGAASQSSFGSAYKLPPPGLLLKPEHALDRGQS